MFECDLIEKPLLERIQSELEADPDLYDVTFSVGSQKTKVKALKIILLAASPVFKNEFKTKWDHSVVRDEEGIPLPDFDGESFQLFVKLTSLDTWSVEVLLKLNLSLNQDLVSICRRYEMRAAVTNLEKLKADLLLSFANFKGTEDFLQLSQANLKEVLSSDDLAMDETEVFECALNWAEWQCKEKKIDASVENLRHVLSGCLFEIRFPVMSIVDFTNVMELKELLSAEEAFRIYKYLGFEDSKRQNCDVRSLAFKTKGRNLVLPLRTRSNASEVQLQQRQTPGAEAEAKTSGAEPLCKKLKGTPTAKPLGCFTLSLLTESRKIDTKNPFACDGSLHQHRFGSHKRFIVVGLGFVGPTDADAFYDVSVEIRHDICNESYTFGAIRKSIFARKGEPFYFVFDGPFQKIIVPKIRFGRIEYSLKGRNTASIVGGHQDTATPLQEGTNTFHLFFESNQLSEILFKRR